MRFVSYLIAGIFVACVPPAVAKEPTAPRNQGDAGTAVEQEKEAGGHAPTDLPKEIEDIRRALGPDYSVDAWQPDLRSSAPRGTRAASDTEPSSPGARASAGFSEEQKALVEKVKALGKEFRESARRLEGLAAEAEEKELYHVADRLRELARSQWKSAREVKGPMPVSTPYRDPITYYGPAVSPSHSNLYPSRIPHSPYPTYSSMSSPSSGAPWEPVEPSLPPGPPPQKPHVDGPPSR